MFVLIRDAWISFDSEVFLFCEALTDEDDEVRTLINGWVAFFRATIKLWPLLDGCAFLLLETVHDDKYDGLCVLVNDGDYLFL